MKYLIYFNDESIHRIADCRNHRELEKYITSEEGTSLNFKEEPEAGAVFFTDNKGREIGFYMEDDNQ